MCFILTHYIGFKGVYFSEGITDFVAGFVTSIVFLITFPKIFKKCEQNNINKNQI